MDLLEALRPIWICWQGRVAGFEEISVPFRVSERFIHNHRSGAVALLVSKRVFLRKSEIPRTKFIPERSTGTRDGCSDSHQLFRARRRKWLEVPLRTNGIT